jgi:hypothetical protein
LIDNPDHDPWSIRQSAVYQQYDSSKEKMVFVLITPSQSVKTGLEKAVDISVNGSKRLDAFELHRIIIGTLHDNWRMYIRSLERVLVNQVCTLTTISSHMLINGKSDHVILSKVQSETERQSPLADSAVKFLERQRLKVLEDKILNLMTIFESLYSTLSALQRQCRKQCRQVLCVDCRCSGIVEELDEQMRDVEMNLKKAEVLHKRAQGTARLVCSVVPLSNCGTDVSIAFGFT